MRFYEEQGELCVQPSMMTTRAKEKSMLITTFSIADYTNVIIAMATVAAIFVSIAQLRKTLKTQEQNKIEDSYYSHRYEAFLVDAWIARKGNERRLIIDNESRGAIRDVKVHVLWPSLDTYDRQLDNLQFHVAPKCHKPWRLLPRGVWCIQTNIQKGYASWDYPKEDTDNFASSPVFFDPKTSHSFEQYALISIDFKDIYDNTWRRVYEDTLAHHEVEAGLYLINTTDPRLRRFISTNSDRLA